MWGCCISHEPEALNPEILLRTLGRMSKYVIKNKSLPTRGDERNKESTLAFSFHKYFDFWKSSRLERTLKAVELRGYVWLHHCMCSSYLLEKVRCFNVPKTSPRAT